MALINYDALIALSNSFFVMAVIPEKDFQNGSKLQIFWIFQSWKGLRGSTQK